MHAAVVTNVGVVVDAVIIERCMDENELVHDGTQYGFAFTCNSGFRTSFSLSMPSSHPPTSFRSSLVSSLSGGPQQTQQQQSTPPLFSTIPPHVPVNSIKTSAVLQSIINDDVHYECCATKQPLRQRIFHLFDVLPFGLESPSSVFSVIGRHTNRGLIIGVKSNGLFVVRPYRTGVPLQLIPYGSNRKTVRKEDLKLLSKLGSSLEVLNGISDFFGIATRWNMEAKKLNAHRGSEGGGFRQVQIDSLEIIENDTNNNNNNNLQDKMEEWGLKDLQLPPQLALHDPVPPLRVGSRVIARRFGCDGSLQIAKVCAVQYDVTYTLCYESDNSKDERVLHNDVHLIDDSEAEQCTVRDKVTVALQKQLPALIIECLGNEEYRIILENNPSQAHTITRRHIVFIAPLLTDALYADPVILEWFRALDPTSSGVVPWKEVRHLILSWEFYGQSLSFQKLGEVQRDLCIRVGRMEPQLLRKVPVQEEEMLLSYAEFEYVIQRVRNLL